jgi:hypothetical protein
MSVWLDAYANTYSDYNCDGDTDGYTHPNSDSYGDGNCNRYSDCDTDCYAYSYTHYDPNHLAKRHPYGDTYFYTKTDTHAAIPTHAAPSSHSTASPESLIPTNHGYPDATFDYVFTSDLKASTLIVTPTNASDHWPVTREFHLH